MIYGYVRVSTNKQNLEPQIKELKKAGAKKIFQEKISGVKKNRPELTKMLDALCEGDVVITIEISRLSRSLKDLLNTIEIINEKKAHIKSIRDTWLDTQSPTGMLVIHILGAIYEFERQMLIERTRTGLAYGRKGGRPAVNDKTRDLALRMRNDGYSYDEIKDATGLARSTVQKYQKLQNENEDYINA